MGWGRRLAGIFDIHPGEGSLVFLFIVHYACLGLADVCVATLSFPLYLKTFGQAALPLAYIATAIMVSLAGVLYLKLAEKILLTHLLIFSIVFLLAGCLFIRGGLELSEVDWLIFILPGWYLMVVLFGNLSVWNLAGRIFDVRQGKRLFGLIGSGRWLGYIAAALVVPLLVGLAGTKNLSILAAVFVGLGLLLQILILRRNTGKVDLKKETKPPLVQKKASRFSGNKYIWLIYAFFFAWALAFYINEQLYLVSANLLFSNAEDLATFLALVSGGVGVITFISNFFIAARVLARFGLKVSLNMVPFVIIAICLPVVVLGFQMGEFGLIYWLIVLMYVLNFSFSLSLQSAGLRVSFQPLTPSQLVRAQTVTESIIEPLGIILSGGMALLISWWFGAGVMPLSWLMGFLGLSIIVTSLLLCREYLVALVQALTRRHLGEGVLYKLDKSSLGIVQKYLKDPYPGSVIYSLDLMEQLEPQSLAAILPRLLTHQAPEVRREALRRIERIKLVAALSDVQKLLASETNLPVLEAALKTLLTLDPTGATAQVIPFLQNPDSQMRRAAIFALIRSHDPIATGLVENELTRLTCSSKPEERQLAATILGETNQPKFSKLLLSLLQDKEVIVWRAALAAAGRTGQEDILGIVISQLDEPRVQSAAVTALVSAGKAALPILRQAWEQPVQSQRTQLNLARVLGFIKGPVAVNLLQTRLENSQDRVRTQVLRSLNACSYHAEGQMIEKVRKQLKNEVAQSVPLLAALNEIQPTGHQAQPVQLLTSALEKAIFRCQERIFYLLSFIYDTHQTDLARAAFFSGLPGRKAYAVEIIDTLMIGHNELKEQALVLLENLSPDERLKRLHYYQSHSRHTLPEHLKNLLTGASPQEESWVKACAIYLAVSLVSTDCSSIISQLSTAASPLVAGMATWATEKLGLVTASTHTPKEDSNKMYSIVEKVIILKSISIFSATPEPVLADVAALLAAEEVKAGTVIFQKGEPGNSMYIIVSGRVKVYDAESILLHLEERQVFGELSLLDSGPRSASIAAVTDSLLFRLDQEAFFDLTEEQPEIMRSILKVVVGQVRARAQDVADLNKRPVTA